MRDTRMVLLCDIPKCPSTFIGSSCHELLTEHESERSDWEVDGEFHFCRLHSIAAKVADLEWSAPTDAHANVDARGHTV